MSNELHALSLDLHSPLPVFLVEHLKENIVTPFDSATIHILELLRKSIVHSVCDFWLLMFYIAV